MKNRFNILVILTILLIGWLGVEMKYNSNIKINPVYWGICNNYDENSKPTYDFSYYNVLISFNYLDYHGEDSKVEAKKKYYGSKNEFYKNLIVGLEEYDVYVSSYTPFLSFSLKELRNKDLKFFEYLTSLPFVDNVEVTEDYQTRQTTLNQAVNQSSSFDVNQSSGSNIDQNSGTYTHGGRTFTGEGIRVGILESMVPDPEYFSDKDNEYLIYDQFHHNTYPRNEYEVDHITMVTNCVLEQAKDVTILYGNVSVGNASGLIGIFDWFIDEGADVATTSHYSFSIENTWIPSNRVTNYYTDVYGLTLCGAAGNGGLVSGYASCPNVIAVGATTANSAGQYPYDYATYTSYENVFPLTPKPNLIDSGDVYYKGQLCSGTSFASPRVAGGIALMMEANSELKGKPYLVMAIIQATADELFDMPIEKVNDLGNFEEHYGAGQFKLSKAMLASIGRTYFTFDCYGHSNYTVVANKTDIYLSIGNRLKISHVMVMHNQGADKTLRFDAMDTSYNSIQFIYSGTYLTGFLTTGLANMLIKEYTITNQGYHEIRLAVFSNCLDAPTAGAIAYSVN